MRPETPPADTLEQRSAARRAIATDRLQRDDPDTTEFDIAFWQRQGADARFAAAWDMVLEARRMRCDRGPEPRLQRSVAVLQRRGPQDLIDVRKLEVGQRSRRKKR